MMTLDDAVDLVLHAFKNGKNGDTFVQKAPAATIDVLVKALLKITNKEDHAIEIIGTRHGEKLYEALCSREEMFAAEDQDNYFCIPADNRDLNYSKYIEEGQRDLSLIEDYNSHNTKQLDVDDMVKLLHKLEFIPEIASGGKAIPDEF